MKHNPVVARLLREQFGVATRTQLLAAGLTPPMLQRELAVGGLEQPLAGVLRSTAHRATFESRAMAVQLNVGDAGALSGQTAARLYGLRKMSATCVWVRTATRCRGRLPPWVVRTESPWLFTGDDAVRQVGPWRLLAPAPMLLTLAEQFNDHRFERAAEDAWHLQLLSPHGAAAFLASCRGRGRNGVARFDRWLATTEAGRRPSQSDFELTVLDAIRRAGLPEPRRQHPVMLPNGELVHLDLAWPEVLLAVEPGHTWWHGGNTKMVADYARDRACGRVGWCVMRYGQEVRGDLASLGREVRETYDVRLAAAR